MHHLGHLSAARQVVGGLLHDAHLHKRARLLLPSRKASAGDDVVLIAAAAVRLIDAHQAVLMSDGQRLKQYRVHHSEERDIRADAEREHHEWR